MKNIFILIGCLILISGTALSQKVVVSDFPVGVAGSVDKDMIKQYYGELKNMADLLHSNPMIRAVITGSADGAKYLKHNDAKNPALALGRAHYLRDFMINEFKVDSSQLVIQSEDAKTKGGQYRYVSIRIDKEYSDFEARLDALEKRPPTEKHFTEIKEINHTFKESLGLRFGLGLSSSPFGAMPVMTSAVTWEDFLYVEGLVGYNFWNNSFHFEDVVLDTRLRMIGGQIVVYPFERLPVGVLGGWVRIEEISQRYYEYVKLSEGLMLGLRMSPFEYLSITGVYNPSKHRIVTDIGSSSKYGQFLISIMAHKSLGGAK